MELGVEYNKGGGWFIGNPDTITETCCAPVYTSDNSYVAQIVGNANSYWMLETRVYGSYKIQRLIGFWGGAYYVRTTQEMGTFTNDWTRCDNFGCNTLAELKAALANV